MTFGISSVPEMFQKRNQKLFKDIENIEVYFYDNISGFEDTHDVIMS